VLTALGFPREWALGSLRVSIGAATRGEQIELFLSILPELVARARKLNVR